MIRAGAFLAGLLLLAACSNAPAGDAGDAYRRGLAALESGQPRVARIELLNAIQAKPNDPAARVAQARTYLALGDGVAAEAELSRARQLKVPADDIHHLLAHAYLLQGDPVRALEEAAKAPAKHAAYAARVRGLALMRQGNGDGAAAAFAEALAGAAEDASLWVDAARFRRSVGDLAGAMAAVDKAIVLRPSDAEAVMLRGELTRSQYGLKAALPWFDRAIELDPTDADAVLERAATLGELGRATEMLAATRKALALKPRHPTAYYLQAVLAARARKFALARSLLERTNGALDGLPSVMLLSGALAYQAGDQELAVEKLGALVGQQPDNRKARRLLAAAQWRSGDPAATIATLQPIVQRADADNYSLALAGRALAAAGDDAAASGFLARAALDRDAEAGTLAQGGASPEIAQVRALIAAGRVDEALARARHLQAEHPGAPDAHVMVGDTLALRGDFAGAAEQYRKAANLAFTEPVALRLVEALERAGSDAAAAEVLRLFLDQNPRNVPARLLAARRAMAAGQWDTAIAAYGSLRRRLGDRDAVLLNNLAWSYAQAGQPTQAIPLARKAWSLDKGNPVTADTLGWLLYSAGRRAEGLALLEQAARGAPDDTHIQRRLELARRN